MKTEASALAGNKLIDWTEGSHVEPPTSEIRGVLSRFLETRLQTDDLCKPLLTDDYVIQTMPDVSPPKWHLGHTTWFFEEFILKELSKSYSPFHKDFGFIFNSYYETAGTRVPRNQRGLLSRPSVEEVYLYRQAINERICEAFEEASQETLDRYIPRIILGIHHEQQHQELLMTDIKHIFWKNPLRPVYQRGAHLNSVQSSDNTFKKNKNWVGFEGGLKLIGNASHAFSFDNEKPQHTVYLNDFYLQSQLITNAEYLEFMEAGGYQDPLLWLSDGWATVEKNQWEAPLYWQKENDHWWLMTLSGMRQVEESEPVCHLSFYEADAFARWKGCRLPTEAEWELAASQFKINGNFLESESYHPVSYVPQQITNASPTTELSQIWGDVWEWTSSAYLAYPGFQPLAGALGEYNGKFMCNQMVLRGGSCLTPYSHIRSTYRNFFLPDSRWQFTGLRLAL